MAPSSASLAVSTSAQSSITTITIDERVAEFINKGR